MMDETVNPHDPASSPLREFSYLQGTFSPVSPSPQRPRLPSLPEEQSTEDPGPYTSPPAQTTAKDLLNMFMAEESDSTNCEFNSNGKRSLSISGQMSKRLRVSEDIHLMEI